MHDIEATVLYPSQCYLGEGPMWHAERKSCFWTNIEGFGFYEYEWASGKTEFYETPYRVSLILQCPGDELIIGVQGGLARFDLESKTTTWLLDLDKQFPNSRCNDGACDSVGRVWIGTMDRNFKPGAGSLYCIDEDLKAQRKVERTTISNGMAWSPDNHIFYYIDTPTQKVQSYDFDAGTGSIHFRKDVITVSNNEGSPDGMAIDEEGMLWVAQWGGHGIYRWNPHTGKQIGKISLPVPNVSSCAFVGDKLEYLLITTAAQDLNPDELKEFPRSGDVFIAQPGVRGLPVNYPTI